MRSGKSKAKQEIKLTFSKVSPVKHKQRIPLGNSVEIVKIPALENSAVLKPNINKFNRGKIEAKEPFEFQSTKNSTKEGNEIKFNLPNNENASLLEEKLMSRVDFDMTKFMKAEMAAHQKVEEIWMERNNTGNNNLNSRMEQQKEPLHIPQSANPIEGFLSTDCAQSKKPEVTMKTK